MSTTNARTVHRMTEMETIRISDFYRDLIQRQLFKHYEDGTCEYLKDWDDKKVLEKLGDGFVMSNVTGFRSRLYGKFRKAPSKGAATTKLKTRVGALEQRANTFNENFGTQAEINESSLRRIRELERLVTELIQGQRKHDTTLGKLALLQAGAHTKDDGDAEIPSMQTDGVGTIISK